MAIYRLELPIYVGLGGRVRNFFHMIEKPTSASSLVGCFWKDRIKLSYCDGEKDYKASFFPVDDKIVLSDSERKKLYRDISVFVSKLNCSMSLVGKDGCEICINLIENLADSAKEIYGENIKSLIVVSISTKSTATELVLNSFFTVVEKSSLNFG